MPEVIIPLNHLRPSDDDAIELQETISRVVSSGWFVAGPEVDAFEREFASACGVLHCVSVANGTDALTLSLSALQIERGSKVATVAVAGGYSSTAIALNGLVPIYIDIDPNGQMDLAGLKQCFQQQDIAATVVTHLYGNTSGANELVEACRQAGVPLVEDCAQAHGAVTPKGPAGSLGTMGCFSFYPTKNLGALGDGGAVVTQDDAIAARLRSLRNYGWTRERYVAETSSAMNSRLDEIQAAVLRLRLPRLAMHNERRRAIAARFLDCIKDESATLERKIGLHDTFHLFVVRSDNRAAIGEHFGRAGIDTRVHYPTPDYHQPRFAPYREPEVSLENTENHCASVLSIPCYPSMNGEAVDRVCDALETVNWQ